MKDRSRRAIEDRLDLGKAKKALKEKGNVSLNKIKADLGLAEHAEHQIALDRLRDKGDSIVWAKVLRKRVVRPKNRRVPPG